jgi:preprotein translocase subunit YajC
MPRRPSGQAPESTQARLPLIRIASIIRLGRQSARPNLSQRSDAVDQTIMLLVLIVGLGAFMFWSQWRARRRYQKKMEELQTGDQVVTIGGIYGKLTYLDQEANRARIEIAPGVEIQVTIGAISQRVSPDTEGA